MADIKLRIEVNPNAESETLGNIVNYVGSSHTNTNVANTGFKADASTGVFTVPQNYVEGANGLSMASGNNDTTYDFIFNDSDELDNIDRMGAVVEDEGNPLEFIWGIVPANKSYSVKLTFTNAQNLKDIIVYGDTVVNQFPIEAIIDGTTTIYSDDPRWAINLQTESTTHTIEFTKWNRAGYNACFSRVRVLMKYLDLDKSWIDNVESLSQSTSDASSIQYGVLANSGSANIRDLDGEFKDLVVDGVLPSSQVPIEVFINGNKIQDHISQNTNYLKNNKMIDFGLSNVLSRFSTITFNGRDLTQNENLFTIFSEIMGSLGYSSTDINNMCSSSIVYGINNSIGTVKQYLQSIVIPYAYIEKGKYDEILNKICTIAQLNLILNDDGNILLVNARPVIPQAQITNAVKIKKSFIISPLEEDLVLKNKFDGVDIRENVITVSRENDEKLNSGVENNTTANIVSKLYKTESYNSKHIRADVYYSTGTIKIPKKTNYSLDEIINIKPELFDYSINYNNRYVYEPDSSVYENQAIGYMSDTNTALNFDNLVTATTRYSSPTIYTESGKAKTYNIPNLGDTYVSALTNNNKHIQFGMTDSSYSSVYVSFDDDSSITVIDSGEYFTINYNVLSKLFLAELYSPHYPQEVGDTNWYFSETSISSIELNIYGDKFIISSSQISASTANVETAKNVVSIDLNELMQIDAKSANTKITDIIKQNILSDYANGVNGGDVDVFCGDLYNSSNTKVKDWANGEILEVGDIVYFDDDLKSDQSQRYWRVTGRKFKYEGQPTLSLELQEIVKIV